ncbi:MAG: helix-turn-helix domain-containing protein [Myxococcota bacterium]
MGRISAEERAQVRARLLQTAAEHFALHGYDGASINRISVAAGYAKGTIYGYFDSKAALFEAVLALGSESTVALFRRMDVAPGIRAELHALACADIKLVQKHEAFAKVLVSEYIRNREETRELVDRGNAPLLKEVARLLRRAKRAEEVSSRLSAVKLARLFCMQLSLLYVEYWRSGTPSWDDMPDVLIELFLDGVYRRSN